MILSLDKKNSNHLISFHHRSSTRRPFGRRAVVGEAQGSHGARFPDGAAQLAHLDAPRLAARARSQDEQLGAKLLKTQNPARRSEDSKYSIGVSNRAVRPHKTA